MTKSPKADNLPFPPLPDQKYGVISIDPPWHFRSRAPVQNPDSDRSPQRHYPTADIEHLKELDVKGAALPDAWVMMWITGPLAVLGVHNILFRAWGVRPSSLAFVWIKTLKNFPGSIDIEPNVLFEGDLHMGTGFTTRANAEFVMLGRIGSPKVARRDIRQIIFAPVGEHSRKPDEFFRRARHFGTGPYLDMFAGAARPGWDAFGFPHREGERPEDMREPV